MEEHANRRVLVIGWDGGTWVVFRPLVDRGLMPHLESLMHRGRWGTLESTIPYLTPVAWTTLLTGLTPQRHGIIGFNEKCFVGDAVLGGEKELTPVSARSVRFPTVLDFFGQAGRRVMSVNVPVTYPPRPVNGILVTGMMTPRGAKQFTWPPELKNELTDYVINLQQRRKIFRSSKQEYEGQVRRWTAVMKQRTETICRLGREHAWEFAIAILVATDRIFHRTWPLLEEYLARGEARTGVDRALETFFRELDASLGTICSAFPDALVMLVSDHGFGPRLEHAVYPNVCLEANGFLFRRKRPVKTSPVMRTAAGCRRAVRRVIETMFSRRLVWKLLAKMEAREVRVLRSLDPERTVAHFVNVDNGTFGAVRLHGETTDAMSETERGKLVDDIIAACRTMTDPETGERITVDVARAEKYFPNPTVDHLPEIVIRFREGYTGRVDPLETELVKGSPASPDGWHRAEGMYLIAGEPVTPGGESAKMHLADVAPTALYLAGLPVPASMQGDVPLSCFDEAYVRTHPVASREEAEERPRRKEPSKKVYTPEQERTIRDHLRGIGYLD